MGKKEDLFYGYKKLQEEAYKNHKLEFSPLEGKFKSDINVKESVIDIEIDHEWVETFDDLFPYVENCIKELRSFLRHDEELINVQLANNININETLSYMTQHTDIIESVDDDTKEVTPGKLINIFNESTYDIYENRFIYTVVNMCQNFFQELINAIEKNLGKHFYIVNMNYKRSEKDDTGLAHEVDASTSHNVTFDKSLKEIQEDEENLPDLAVVRRLSAQIADWQDTELIRALKGVKEVSSPLTMTNVLQKNPNFQKAVILFNYIESYSKEKFKIKHTEKEVKLTSKMQSLFMELTNTNDMIQRYSLDKNFANVMDERYAARIKEEEEEAKRQAEKLEEEIQQRISEAVDGQATQDQITFDEMEKKYKRVINVFQSVSTKELNEAIEDFNRRSDIELEDRLNFENTLRRKYVDDVETLKNSFEVQYEAFRHEMQIEKNQFIIDQTTQLRAYDESYKKEIDKLNLVHAAEIKKAHILSEKDKKELIRAHKGELLAQQKEFEAQSQALVSEYENKMSDVKKECENSITELTSTLKLEKQSLIQDYENAASVAKADYEEKITILNDRAKLDIQKLEKAKEKEIEDLVKDFEATKNDLAKEAVRTLTEEKAALENKYKTLEVESNIIIEKERSEHENRLKRLIAEHELEISTVKRDADKSVREAVINGENAVLEATKAKEECENTISELKTRVEQLEAERDAKETEEVILLNRSYKKDLDATIENYEKQLASLQVILQRYKDDLANAKKRQQDEVDAVKAEYDKIIQRQQNTYAENLAKNEAAYNLTYSKLNQQNQANADQMSKDYHNLEEKLNEANAKNSELERKIAELTLKLNAEAKKVEVKVVETPVVEAPKVEEKVVEQPKVEVKPVEQPKPVETPKVETPKVEQPKVEQPKVEEPKVEVKPVEQPKPVETPKVEEPKEEPKKVNDKDIVIELGNRGRRR